MPLAGLNEVIVGGPLLPQLDIVPAIETVPEVAVPVNTMLYVLPVVESVAVQVPVILPTVPFGLTRVVLVGLFCQTICVVVILVTVFDITN